MDDFERKLARLDEKVKKLSESNGGIGSSLDEKQRELSSKPLQDLDVSELEKHQKDVKSIGASLERGEKERERVDEEY